jgi:hypothetical protein
MSSHRIALQIFFHCMKTFKNNILIQILTIKKTSHRSFGNVGKKKYIGTALSPPPCCLGLNGTSDLLKTGTPLHVVKDLQMIFSLTGNFRLTQNRNTFACGEGSANIRGHSSPSSSPGTNRDLCSANCHRGTVMLGHCLRTIDGHVC